MTVYYNEIDPYAAQWLRNLIQQGLIADGEVDTRSIVDVRPDDLAGFAQCHFFAGIGGWSYALRLSGWDDARPVWTGSCPCQPFSLAGAQRGFSDDRHLWPVWRDLIRERRPAKVFGEQVASATEWLGLVRSDLEAMGYAVGAMPIQAASAGADHIRDRYWFLADASVQRGETGLSGSVARNEGHARILDDGGYEIGMANANQSGTSPERQQRSGKLSGAGSDQESRPLGNGCSTTSERISRSLSGTQAPVDSPREFDGSEFDGPAIASASELEWVIGADGKARRVKSGVRLLAHGVPARVGKLRGFGNAIDPRPASEFIKAAMNAVRADKAGD